MTSHKRGNNGAVREENLLKVSLVTLETIAEHFWETHRLTEVIHMLSQGSRLHLRIVC